MSSSNPSKEGMPPRVRPRAALLCLTLGLVAAWAAERCAAEDLLQPRPNVADLIGGFGASDKDEFVAIQNDGLLLAFHKGTGRLAVVADKAARLDLLTGSAMQPIFRLELTRPAKGEHGVLTADGFGRVDVEKKRAAKGTAELILRFSECAYGDFIATCRFVAMRGSPLIEAQIQVNNNTDWAIRSADFPTLLLSPTIGETCADDEVLFPSMGGVVFKGPVEARPRANASFPGVASYQMVSYYDADAGIYLATYDATGEVKNFRASARPDGLDLTPRHLRPEVVGADFEDRYPTVLAPIRAPWHNAADRYKAWAVKQPWCKTPLVERKDLPDWLKSGAPFLWATTTLPQLGAVLRQDDPDGLIETIDRYREAAGAKHIIYSVSGWEKQGAWAGIDYFPTSPPEKWWDSFCVRAKTRNIHAALMTSGFRWMVKRKAWANGPEIDCTNDWRGRAQMAITNADGTPFLNDTQYEKRDWVGAYSKVCRGSKAGQDVIADIFVRLATMGVSMSSFDQTLGGGEDTPCYHPDHKHPPGHGRWEWETYREIHERILREARKYEPDFFLYQENEGELTIPYQGTTWARNYHILNHPHEGAWGVPVYPYLYHEYITCIGAAVIYGLGAPVGNSDPAARAYAIARCLVFGQIQGDFAEAVLLNEQGDPESIPSRAYFSFCRPLSDHAEFLILGKMKRPLELACGETTLTMLPDERLPKEQRKSFDIQMPAVIHGVFESPGGTTGVIVANATATAQRAVLTLPTPYPGAEDIVHEFRNGVETTAHSGAPGRRIELSLEAFEPVFLRLD